MVGGKVSETKVLDDKVWINCQEYIQSENKLLNHFSAIYVELSAKARCVSEGDIVWWQGGRAYWTPKDSKGKTIGKGDIVLQRIGFSGVTKPKTEKI